MAMEVVCGNCQGRLLVEQTGVIVACPHCGAHLQIGDPAPPPTPAPPPVFVPPVPQPVAPAPFIPPVAPPPPVSAAPQFSPFPISFEPPAAKDQGSFFPEIVLTPKTAPAPPAVSKPVTKPAPVPAIVPPPAPVSAAPAVTAPFPISFEPPAEPAASAAPSEPFFPEIVLNSPAPPYLGAKPPGVDPVVETNVAPTPAPVITPPSVPVVTPTFEPPAVVVPEAAAEPEPQFPEINLTPPTVSEPAPPVPVVTSETAASETSGAAVTPVAEPVTPVTTPDPAPASIEPPAWSPTPEADAESESWMPAIDLTMPPRDKRPAAEAPTSEVTPVESPALIGAAVGSVPAADDQSDKATTLTPVLTVAETSPSTVNLTAHAPAAAPAHQTDIWKTEIWSPSRPENAPVAEPAFGSFGEFSAGDIPTVTLNAPVANAAAAVSSAPPSVAVDSRATTSPTAAATSAGPAIVTNNNEREPGVPRIYFVIVASYASAMTLAFLYVWLRGNVSTLDLPDVVPAFKNGKYGMVLIDEGPLPSPFRLKLGESKRYGNLLVTPLKVTKGPLQFVHFDGDGQTRPATDSPVLKLWVKFENVSTDQTFPPLDEKLLFQRAPDREVTTQDRTNNYICLQSERKRSGKRIPVYTFPINGEWILKDQGLNSLVEPQSSWETYIPSNDEDLSDLKGPLCWRVHFRKGYNPKSRRGVTTLVEVEFDSKDIQADS